MSFSTLQNVTYLSGTQTDYDNLAEKDSSTFYITTDTHRIYLGEIEYTSNNDSFYGGNPLNNNSFVSKSFPSVANMESNFALGVEYTEVQYGEYVIIDVPTGGDAQEYAANQGKIYKRGFNGPEYICRIAGPAGDPSLLNIVSMSNITNYETQNNTTLQQHTASLTNSSLIPGKVEQENDDPIYNDSINWKYYHTTVANADQTNLGFTIPYPTFNFAIDIADIDYPKVVDTSEIENGQKKHPFHSDIKILLPQYKYGRSVDQLLIRNADTNDGIDYGDTDLSLVTSYKTNHTPVLAYVLTEYDENNELSSSVKFLSEFKIVDNIDISENGYLRFWLPYGAQDQNQNPLYISSSLPVIPQLTGSTLDSDGTMTLNWNNPLNNTTFTTTFENKLKWISSIETSSSGNILIRWNNGDESTTIPVTNDFNLNNLIVDLIIYDSILYKRYLGLDQEISTITGIALDQLPTENDAAVNALANATNTYHKDMISNIWYKKLFDIRTLLNNQTQNNGS